MEGLDNLVGDISWLLLIWRVLEDLVIGHWRFIGAAFEWRADTGLETLAGLDDDDDQDDTEDHSGGAEDGNKLCVVDRDTALVSLWALLETTVHVKTGNVHVSQVWRIPASYKSDTVALVDSGDDNRL